MRHAPWLGALLLIAACGGSEAAKTDSAAAMTAMPPAPMPLTEADMMGTWKGTTMAMGSDSVVNHWTELCGAGVCKGIIDGMKDTMVQNYVLSGDSAIGTSVVYEEPTMKGMKLQDTWVLRIANGKVMGTGHAHLATKPDSIVMRYRFEGMRAP
jgi:hypothetical protein